MIAVGPALPSFHVAIVGSGPSGFYAAEAILKACPNARINLIEKLPVPFGLVRYGVAPDHPKLKQVILVFDKIAQNPNVHFFGNVEFGKDVTLSDLRSSHHATILCIGAAMDRRLNIPGENLRGSHTATEFVAWYNGHPDYRNLIFDFSNEHAVIIGQGNVAADVCRILAKPVEELRLTDIASHAIEQLAESRIRQIHLIGRRGPAQAKFTTKELRELGEISGCLTEIAEPGIVLAPEDREELADQANDNAAKCVELFRQFGAVVPTAHNRQVTFHFNLSPIEMRGKSSLERIIFARNNLTGNAFSRTAIPNGETFNLDCGLCFRSIGYRGQSVPGVPHDGQKGLIPNIAGRVVGAQNEPIEGLYVSGWIKRGPSGTIGTNRADSLETVDCILQDAQKYSSHPASFDDGALEDLLRRKGIKAIGYKQWELIDAEERKIGNEIGKPREKFSLIRDMISVAHSGKIPTNEVRN